MKRKAASVVLFVAVFVATYLIICFCIPGMKIKLEAEPTEYFFASIKHMAVFKSLISLVIGAIFGILSIVVGKKKQ